MKGTKYRIIRNVRSIDRSVSVSGSKGKEKDEAYNYELMMPLVSVCVRVLLDHAGVTEPCWRVAECSESVESISGRMKERE